MAVRRSIKFLFWCQSRTYASLAGLKSTAPCCPAFNQNFTKLCQVTKFSSAQNSIKESEEYERLYRAIDVYIKGHEDSVLQSYSEFAAMAANELGIEVAEILKPKMITDRVTLLRSVFVHKKHRTQYEAQTHKRVVQLKHLTGSTADTFLSYIQINIPPGVAMEVHKWEIERLPKHLEEAMERNVDQLTEDDEMTTKRLRDKRFQSKAKTETDYEEYKTTKPYLIGTHG